MSSLQILQGTFRLGDTKTLQLHQLMLNAGDSWAFVGSNGSGKSALARALAGELPLLKGERQSLFSHITRLSFEQLQKLVSDEWQRNNTDMLSPGEDDTGRTTAEIIQDEVKDAPRCAQLAHSELLEGVQLPEPDEPSARHALPANEPRIVLNNGVVSYNDRPILNNLSWQVNPGEHWQIVGPNGAGKSTLLSLITGDHPQGYSNDLTLFGRRRGSGETIWDIKKHIGYVSSSLHLDYRVSTTVRNVILSGYFGIYQAVSDRQQKLVQQWLDILGIDKRTADAPFHSLSWGQQRLALIVRALVKHPTLLILDEPLQGLDPLNRQLIRRFVDVLISEGETQLLFVSHHAEDAPACITHRLEFVPDGDFYRYALTKIN
ncbi:molybdate ABC transporter ATP-binding protein ModF [Escherichia albertii]|nr:molybdate ABC transporter ATP-binding protein ModF [Escherichia albertii]